MTISQDNANIRRSWCQYGHWYRWTVLERQLYKGPLPMPCPICGRKP